MALELKQFQRDTLDALLSRTPTATLRCPLLYLTQAYATDRLTAEVSRQHSY